MAPTLRITVIVDVEAAPAHRCSILVVDDDPEARAVLRAGLEADGYAVRTAKTGREALNLLRSTPSTCVILLDLLLPGMDGMQFRQVQARDRSLAWIPVVIISAAIDAPRIAREVGARAFLPKPVDIDRVRQTVRLIGCAYRARRGDARIDAGTNSRNPPEIGHRQ